MKKTPVKNPAKSVNELLERYSNGDRNFAYSILKEANLKDVNLDGAIFFGTDFSGACLDGASLSETNLIETDFRNASLRNAKITPASAVSADFYKADLEGANLHATLFRDSCLVEANLSRCDLTQTGFDNALFGLTKLYDTTLSFTYLSEIQYGQAPEHKHPIENYVNKATVKMSASPLRLSLHNLVEDKNAQDWIMKQRKVLVKFFEVCGVSRFELEVAGLLETDTQDTSSVFISYAGKDEEFVTRLEKSLSNAGVKTWFAPRMMKGGMPIFEQISKAIHTHDRLLLVLSENSVNSNWVKTEILTTRDIERKTGKRMFFPIRLTSFDDLTNWVLFDGDSGSDLARYAREYFIPDFSNWKDKNSYDIAINKLILDLRKEE